MAGSALATVLAASGANIHWLHVRAAALSFHPPEVQERKPHQDDRDEAANLHRHHRREPIASGRRIPVEAAQQHLLPGAAQLAWRGIDEREGQIARGELEAVERL